MIERGTRRVRKIDRQTDNETGREMKEEIEEEGNRRI